MKIALFPNLEKTGAENLTAEICEILHKNGDELYIHRSLDGRFNFTNPCQHHFELADTCDVIVTVGGDGTILHAAKHAAAFGKPILGINLGRVGYLAGLEPENINQIPSVLAGNSITEERSMLKVEVNGKALPYLALNEGVLKGELTKTIDFTVDVNGSGNFPHRGDGIIISTPTGSTAYSMAAGGPIVDPTLNCMLFTPICPFSLYDRTTIYGGNTKLDIRIKSDSRVYLTIDGNAPIEISNKDTVSFSVAEKGVKLIRSGTKNFYEVVSTKLITGQR
ncbi:MAG: NAD(+)/NADH kinase [Clostridia bacterium]|nr:NAD(+)/NADH kinase [Clostridia bacterium]